MRCHDGRAVCIGELFFRCQFVDQRKRENQNAASKGNKSEIRVQDKADGHEDRNPGGVAECQDALTRQEFTNRVDIANSLDRRGIRLQ